MHNPPKKIYPLGLLLMQHRNTHYQGNSYFSQKTSSALLQWELTPLISARTKPWG